MIINMTTIAVRKNQYIDQTLESLFRSDGRDIPVNLILGSSDSSHVEKYRNTLNIVSWDAEDEARARVGEMRHNCNVNALRALRYGDDDYCLCCEDDIRFKEDWFSQLMLTIAEIGHSEYVLNLGQGCDQSPDKRYAVHTRSSLVGAQAIFYPTRELRTAVADYLDEAVRFYLDRSVFRGTNDHLIGQYAKKYAALYNTTPMLVGHIGQVSSFSGHPPVPKRAAPPRPTAGLPPMFPPPAVEPRADAPPQPLARTAGDVARSEARFRATAQIFLDLLRASLGRAAPPAAARLGDCDWRRLVQMATDHGLMPVMYSALQACEAGVPEEWRRRFKAPYVANVFHSQLAQRSVDEIGAAFDEERILVTVLNEAALQRGLYDDPALRVVSAIDVLVDVCEVERASARLQLLGSRALERTNERRPLSHFHRVHRSADAGTIPVDLYWRPFEPYQPYVFDRDAVRAQARPFDAARPNVLVMAPEHELVHLCLRLDRWAAVHGSLIGSNDLLELLLLPQGSERLVRLYDIALYVQKRSASIHWEGLVDTARRWAIDGHAGATLELVRRVLDVGPPPEVLRDLNRSRPRWVDHIAHRVMLASHRANEGRGSGSGRGHSRRLELLSGHVLRFARGWLALFPPRAYLRATYAGRGTSRGSWALHLREVIPGLWAETRERLRSAVLRHS